MSTQGSISSVSDSEPIHLPLPWGCGLGRTEQPALQGTRWDWRLGRDLKRRDTRLIRGNTPLPLKAPLPASSTVREHLQRLKGKQREHPSPGHPICNFCSCQECWLFVMCMVCVRSFEMYLLPFYTSNNIQRGAVSTAMCRAHAQ